MHATAAVLAALLFARRSVHRRGSHLCRILHLDRICVSLVVIVEGNFVRIRRLVGSEGCWRRRVGRIDARSLGHRRRRSVVVVQGSELDVQVSREPMPRLEGGEQGVQWRRAEGVGVDLCLEHSKLRSQIRFNRKLERPTSSRKKGFSRTSAAVSPCCSIPSGQSCERKTSIWSPRFLSCETGGEYERKDFRACGNRYLHRETPVYLH